MPPHLHPRSRSTTSLFTAALFTSFIVVGMPHIFPCPAPRRTLADSDMTMAADGQSVERMRGKRRNPIEIDTPRQLSQIDDTSSKLPQATNEVSTFLRMEEEAARIENFGRKCPVPKPGGIIGELLGFKTRGDKQEGWNGATRSDIPSRDSKN